MFRLKKSLPVVLLALFASLVVASPVSSLDSSLDPTAGVRFMIGEGTDGNNLVYDSLDRLIVTGECESDGEDQDFCTVRYTADGELDTSFGTDGTVITDVAGHYDYADGVVVDSMDRVIVTGRCYPDAGDQDFCTVRYTADGVLDTEFGTDGIVITDVAGDDNYDYADGVVVDSMDRVIVSGGCYPDGGDVDFCTVRYTADGVLDTSFGTAGIVITDVAGDENYDNANGVVVDSMDRVIVSGGCKPDGEDQDFCTVRYTADGVLDTEFGTDGIVITDVAGDDNNDWADGVVVDSMDRVIVGGECYPDDEDEMLCLARYTEDGSLDATFGDGGILLQGIIENSPDDLWMRDLAIDQSDRITVAATCEYSIDEYYYGELCAFRFLSDGSLDLSWGGGDGVATWSLQTDPDAPLPQSFWPDALALDSSGNPAVLGSSPACYGDDDEYCVVFLLTAPIFIDCLSDNWPVPFTDIDASSYAYDAVGCLYDLGITHGTSFETYSPHDVVTREQMAAFLARTWDSVSGVPCSSEHPFTDIDASSYAYDAVGCLYDLGVTHGTSFETYSPHDVVTREQMAAFLARMYRAATGEDCSSLSFFEDVPSNSFAQYDIGCLYDLGIAHGTSFETYSPHHVVTREQMAAFLARLYTAIEATT